MKLSTGLNLLGSACSDVDYPRNYYKIGRQGAQSADTEKQVHSVGKHNISAITLMWLG